MFGNIMARQVLNIDNDVSYYIIQYLINDRCFKIYWKLFVTALCLINRDLN